MNNPDFQKKERLIVILLTLVQVCHVLDFVIMMPLGPMLIRSLHISSSEFARLVSAYTVSAGFFSLLGTFVTERYERKNFMLLLFLGFILGTVFCALANSYETLMGARIIAGGFGGLFGATVFAMVADYVPPQRRGSALGIVMTSFPIASVAGVPLGLMIANQFGWQSPFIFIVALSLMFAVFAFVSLPPAQNKRSFDFRPLDTLKEILLNKNHLNAFFLLQTYMFAIFFVIPYIAPFMVKNIGIQEDELPYIYFFGGLLTFATSQFIGKLTDRFGAEKLFIIISCLSFAPILLITHLSPRPFWQVILVTCFFMSMVSGRNVPSMTLMLSRVLSKTRGSFMALSSSSQQLAVGLSSFLGGEILRENTEGKILNYNELGYIAIGASLIGVLIGLSLIKKPTQLE